MVRAKFAAVHYQLLEAGHGWSLSFLTISAAMGGAPQGAWDLEVMHRAAVLGVVCCKRDEKENKTGGRHLKDACKSVLGLQKTVHRQTMSPYLGAPLVVPHHREAEETANTDRSFAKEVSFPGIQDLSPVFDSTCKSMEAERQSAVNGKSTKFADLLSYSHFKKHVDMKRPRAEGKEAAHKTLSHSSEMTSLAETMQSMKEHGTISSISFSSLTTPAENMQSLRENGTITAIDGDNNMDVCALSIPELMKYAFALGVPTRKKTRNGHRCRRALRDVRAECVARQREGLILRQQSPCDKKTNTKEESFLCQVREEERESKKSFPCQVRDVLRHSRKHVDTDRCGMKWKEVMMWAISLGVATRKRGTKTWRRVADVWSDCIRLESPPQQFMDENRKTREKKPYPVRCGLNKKAAIRRCNSFRIEPGRQRGIRPEVLQLAVALGIETRRGPRAEVMRLATELGIETHNHDEKNRKRWRGAKEVWKDVVALQKACHVFGTGSAKDMLSFQEVPIPSAVHRPQAE